MIIAWVLSILVVLTSLISCLEKMTALEIIGVNAALEAQSQFIAAEKSLTECEKNLSNLSALENPPCYFQSAGKNLWLLSTKKNPQLETLVALEGGSGQTRRLNWRKIFE